MSEQARTFIMSTLASGATALVSLHLDAPLRVSSDGRDSEQRAVELIGATQARSTPTREAFVAGTLAALAEGWTPEGVHPLALAPQMAAASDEIVYGTADEGLVAGERGTGKTFGTSLTLVRLAEAHHRAGFPLPLVALWVHDSLASASAKTVPSLEEPTWGGHWRIRGGGGG